jgi:hypothetical protein
MGRDDHAGRDPDRALQGRSLADGAKLTRRHWARSTGNYVTWRCSRAPRSALRSVRAPSQSP